MIYSRGLRKLISIAVIIAVVFYGDLFVYSQGGGDVVKQFQLAKEEFNKGQYVNAKYRIERILGTIKGQGQEKKDMFGACYLLLGAIYEKEGTMSLAEENYRRAKEEYSVESIAGVDLNSLPIYNRVVKRKIDTEPSLSPILNYIMIMEFERLIKKRLIDFQYEKAVEEYNNGLYDNSKTSLERVIVTISEKSLEVEKKEILGKCYLLLGAIYEKKGETLLAEENYRRAKEDYGVESVEGVALENLSIYKMIIKGERIIVEEGKKPGTKSKKFPILLVVGGVVIVAAVVLLLKKKKEPSPTPTFVTNTDSLNIPEGGTADFTVRLSAQPASTVSVSVTRVSGDTDINIQTGSSLTFTSSNWNQNQTVTLAANEDIDTSNGSATIRISASGIQNKDLTATEQDNDTLQFITNTSSVTINEGSTAPFQVKLSNQPAANIQATVTRVSGDTDISVESGGSLTFTNSNWNTYQIVTLNAADDTDAINGQATIRISAVGIPDKNIIATEFDTDSIHFVTDVDFVSIPEGGTNVLKVKLSKLPASDVTANISWVRGDSDITVKPENSVLTFTTTNGNNYQNVTLRAKEDSDTINGQATIRISCSNISGIPDKDIIATEIDNDTLNFVTDKNEVTVLEGGTGTFQLKLSAQPTSDLTVAVTFFDGDTDISVSPGSSSLVFTTTDWNTYQTVTLQAAEDADTIDGQATIRISSPGVPDKIITAKEADNDSA
ncbi:MAG: hypothetical protein QG657_697 [Acidobacteriota bacterium]|nr:hypothetical protein [Acidobacteriota bacterium]